MSLIRPIRPTKHRSFLLQRRLARLRSTFRFKTKKILILLIPLILIQLLLLGLIRPKSAEAAWADDRYAYRQLITFTHNAALTDTAMRITVSNTDTLVSAGKIQSDCDDSRFTDSNGKVLRYKLISGCNGASTVYDVIFPIVNNGSNLAYLYYGNPAATSASDSSVPTGTTPSGSPSFAPEEQGTTPLLYWNFDEGYGTTANDTSSYSNSGSFKASGEPVIKNEEMCYIGKCVTFDGTNDYVRRAYSSDTELDIGTNSFTVSAWFNHPITISGTDILLARSNNAINGIGYKLYMNSSGFICFGIDDDATWTPDYTACTSTSYADNKWHFVTGVKTSTTSITLYIDGNSITTTSPITNATGSLSGSSANFVVGNDGDSGTTNPWIGSIDEVKFYNFAKTASQIKTDFTNKGGLDAASASFGSNDQSTALSQGLVGYWKMDESAADSCTGGTNDTCDSSSNSYDGAWAASGNAVASGRYGNGVSGDGSTGRVTMSDVLDMDANASFTLSTWVYRTSVASDDFILQKSGNISDTNWAGYGFYQWGTANGGNTCFTVSDSANYYTTCTADNTTETLNTWQHIVGVFDRKNGKVGSAIYVDGKNAEATVYEVMTGTVGSASNNQNLMMGDIAGRLDDVRIYNRALSPSEVASLYDWAPAPIAYLPLDEGTGTTANDRSGNANTGTLTNSPKWAAGKYNSSVDFLGSSSTSSINAGSNSVIDDVTVKTIEAWVYPRSYDPTNPTRFADKSGATGWYFGLLNNSTSLTFQQSFATQTGQWKTTGGVTLNSWNHVVVIYDRTDSSQIPTFYINSVLQTTTSPAILTPSGSVQTDASGSLYLGNRSDGARTFDGRIDDFRIYNYARTAKQIVSDMNGGHPSVGSPVGSAVGHWSFDEGYGTAANNSGSGGATYNGTLLGSTLPTWTGDGKFGKAIDFSGGQAADGDTNIRLVNDSFDTHTEGSLSFWMKADDTGDTTQMIFGAAEDDNGSGTDYVRLYFNTSTNVLSFDVKDNNAFVIEYDSPTLTSTTSWHHVVITNSTTGNRMFIDGKQATPTYFTGSAATDAWFDNISENTTGYSLGCITYDASDANDCDDSAIYQGLLDEVKLYNYALSADEVKIDYNQNRSQVMGALSTASDGITADNSSAREYCVPGDTTSCSAPGAEWNFDENTGTSANDITGNGNTGTLTGATLPRWTFGKNNAGVSFAPCNSDGSANCRITVSAASSINNIFATGGTFEAWIKPVTNGVSGDGRIIDKRTSTPSLGWSAITQSDTASTVKLLFVHDSSGTSGQYTITGVPKNSWSHIAVIFSKTSFNAAPTTYKPTIYLNAVPQTVTIVGTPSGTASDDSGQGITIGNSTGTGRNFDGAIDTIRLYSYARTQAQVAWDYNKGAPAGWWQLDECQGTTAYDASGNGNNGTLTPGGSGNTTAGSCGSGSSTEMRNSNSASTGKINNSLDFDGTNDYVVMSTSNPLQANDDVTLSAWVKFDSLGSNNAVAAFFGSSSDKGYWINVTSDGTPYFWGSYDGSAQDAANGSAGQITTGTWHHITGVISGTTLKLYVNGKLIDTSTMANDANVVVTASAFAIGRLGAVDSDYTNGLIDDVRVYNYAVTDAQAKLIYNDGAAVRFGPISGTP